MLFSVGDMKSEDIVYNAVIAVLGALNLIAALIVTVVCCLYCCKRRARMSNKVESDSNSVHHGSITNKLAGEDKHCLLELTGAIQLIEVIHGNTKRWTLWKATYEASIVCVKSTQHDLWANEMSIYSLSSTANEFILQCIGCQYRNFYVICEYHPLGSLNDYLRDNTLNLLQAIRMMLSVSSGLAHLHSNFYVNVDECFIKKFAIAHRDVKSANVWVKDHGGHCVIGDFSQALVLNHTATRKCLFRKRKVGTIHYMSPETLEGRMNLLDTESFKQNDIYALTLLIWEVSNRCCICEGEAVGDHVVPFSDIVGENPTMEMMSKIVVVENRRPLLSALWNEDKVLKKIKQIMTEGWDEDPEARLTAANISNQLESLQKRLTFFERSLSESLSMPNGDIQTVQHSEITVSENSGNSDTTPHVLEISNV